MDESKGKCKEERGREIEAEIEQVEERVEMKLTGIRQSGRHA